MKFDLQKFNVGVDMKFDLQKFINVDELKNWLKEVTDSLEENKKKQRILKFMIADFILKESKNFFTIQYDFSKKDSIEVKTIFYRNNKKTTNVSCFKKDDYDSEIEQKDFLFEKIAIDLMKLKKD